MVDTQRHRFVRSDIDLVKQLPPGDFTRFYADLGELRKAGLLHLLTGQSPVQEKDYEEFVRQTEFDYTRDMEAVAGASDGEQFFFLIRGRFQWNKLKEYAVAHGGLAGANPAQFRPASRDIGRISCGCNPMSPVWR